MSQRILIADDDRDSADSLAMLLRRTGFEAQPAYSGQEAIETAIVFDPDVLILDLAMPHLDGFQVAHRLRAEPRFAQKHFIALSGHSDQKYLDEASQVQFDDYLIKPCKLEMLLAILSEVGRTSTRGHCGDGRTQSQSAAASRQ